MLSFAKLYLFKKLLIFCATIGLQTLAPVIPLTINGVLRLKCDFALDGIRTHFIGCSIG